MITTIQLIVLTSYIIFIMYMYEGIPSSISDSTYFLSKSQRYLFTAALWITALLNYYQPMEMYGALTSAGLFFTGATVSFKKPNSFNDEVHYLGAGSAIILSFVGLVMLHGMWFVPLIALVLMLPFIKSKNIIWWVEIISILCIFGSYYFI